MPLSSMTGFSTASDKGDKLAWRWDLRSVNGRGLDLRLRLPPGAETLEAKARGLIQDCLSRGSVQASLTIELIELTRTAYCPNVDNIDAAVGAVGELRNAFEKRGVPLAPVQVEALLSLPGVLGGDNTNPASQIPEAQNAILATLKRALDEMLTARGEEGRQLQDLITDQLSRIETLTRDASACAEAAIQALRARLKKQISGLLDESVQLDMGRLEQEIATLATKADVREEIDRLNAHTAAAHALIEDGKPIGRRLEFLTQEFNREANTLCSKAATDEMTRVGLELKAVIDQMREQAANVE